MYSVAHSFPQQEPILVNMGFGEKMTRIIELLFSLTETRHVFFKLWTFWRKWATVIGSSICN